eukprot:1097493-Amphidinium_carterae.1
MVVAGCQCLWRPLLSGAVAGQSCEGPGQRDYGGPPSHAVASPEVGPLASSLGSVACLSWPRLAPCEQTLRKQHTSLQLAGGQMEVSKGPLQTSSPPLVWAKEIGAVCLERSLCALSPLSGSSGRLWAPECHQ